MQIVDFTEKYVADARTLVMENYQEERQHVSSLPEIREIPRLCESAGDGLSVAAVENGRLMGFWGCMGPWENEFGSNAKGMFTPIHFHGAVREKRENIYRRMYQSLAERLVRQGIAYHTVALYAHDFSAVQGLFTCGFGMRCVDAVRTLDEINVTGESARGITCREIGRADFPKIRKLRAGLGEHLGKSPCFIKMSDADIENWQQRKESGSVRVFAAWQEEEPVAYLEIAKDGENFVTEVPEMQNICGAYCRPADRGQNIMQMLLNHVIAVLKEEGCSRLGVDYESLNLSAWSFWKKYFDAYTCSLTRRIVESACGNPKSPQ